MKHLMFTLVIHIISTIINATIPHNTDSPAPTALLLLATVLSLPGV